MRNIAYNLCYDPHSSLPFDDIHIDEKDGQKYICMTFKHKTYCERLTDGDLQSLAQEEKTVDDLAYKYFAYLTLL